jgi:hypothetical protein
MLFDLLDTEVVRLIILAIVFTYFGLLIRSGIKR